MSFPDGEVIRLGLEQAEEAAEVLTHAFARDPLMHAIFADQVDKERARRELSWFSCAVRFELDWPLFGVLSGGQIVGVAGITGIEPKAWPESLRATYAALTAAIGPQATARLERYSELAEAHRPTEPNYMLGVIGVRPGRQGKGYGRRLLAAVQAVSDADPASTGIYLDTENPVNLPFYEHAGYQVIAREQFEGVTIWCMFRPTR